MIFLFVLCEQEEEYIQDAATEQLIEVQLINVCSSYTTSTNVYVVYHASVSVYDITNSEHNQYALIEQSPYCMCHM